MCVIHLECSTDWVYIAAQRDLFVGTKQCQRDRNIYIYIYIKGTKNKE